MNALRFVLCLVLSVALALPAQATAFLSPAVKVHEPEDAFGNLTHRSGSTTNAYLYAGEQYDADLGLYYLRARYLNPDSGRFWSMDIYEGLTEDPASLHKYLYANANPIDGIDPSGYMNLSEVSTSLIESVNFGLRLARPAINAIVKFRQVACKVAEQGIWQAHHLINLNFGGAGSRRGARKADLVAGITVKVTSKLHTAYHSVLNKTLQFIAGIPGNTKKAEVLRKRASGEISDWQLQAAMVTAALAIDAVCVGVPGYTYLTPRLIGEFKQRGF